jgi:hypothetical protein
MAKIESDKEDLIVEATALVERAEYLPDNEPTFPWNVVTIGYRKDGSLSLYCDQDPFYQFDNAGRLRRAHVGGLLYRSQSGTLAELNRQRTEHQTILQRKDLNTDQKNQFQRQMTDCLNRLQSAFGAGQLHKNRSVPADLCLTERTMAFIECVLARGTDFLSDSIRTRK